MALHIGGSLFFAFWNAIAQYTPTMQPLWPIPGVAKRPPNPYEQTVAMVYAVYRLAEAVFPPEFNVLWASPGPYGPNGLFGALGLDVNDRSTDPTTAVGIGNLVGADVVQKHTSSKWNALVSCAWQLGVDATGTNHVCRACKRTIELGCVVRPECERWLWPAKAC